MDINLPYHQSWFDDEEINEVVATLKSGWLTTGPRTKRFEDDFKEYIGCKYAIGLNSCTAGLHLALAVMRFEPGDEVITTTMTFPATVNVMIHERLCPVFVDVEPGTLTMDVSKIEQNITPRTRAIVPVHFAGHPCNMDPIMDIAKKYKLIVIEDAAHALESKYKGRKIGNLGNPTAFSFYANKNITTGEGGMITTNSDELAERLRRLRNHGASIPEEVRHRGPKPHELPAFDEFGFNYRMTDLQGAVGLEQLKKLEGFIEERSKWAQWYRDELDVFEWLHCPQEPQEGRHSWQSFVTWVEPDAPLTRNELMDRLHEKGISTRPGTHAVTDLGAYRDFKSKCPVATECAEQTMAIPLHNQMREVDYVRVVDEIKRIGEA